MKKILIAALFPLAFIAGAFGGEVLRDRRATSSSGEEISDITATKGDEKGVEPDSTSRNSATSQPETVQKSGPVDWFRFPNQFFVPLVRNSATEAVMILDLSLEVSANSLEAITAQELRLRDALLGALMIEANTGAFDGNFTTDASMTRLRNALLKAAHRAGGTEIRKVLIGDIARQDQ